MHLSREEAFLFISFAVIINFQGKQGDALEKGKCRELKIPVQILKITEIFRSGYRRIQYIWASCQGIRSLADLLFVRRDIYRIKSEPSRRIFYLYLLVGIKLVWVLIMRNIISLVINSAVQGKYDYIVFIVLKRILSRRIRPVRS